MPSQTIIDNQLVIGAVVAGRRFARGGVRQKIAEQIRPQLVVPWPGQPIRGPAALGVGGEHGGAAQLVLPAHQQRVLLIHREDGLGRGLRDESDIPAQRRRRLHPHARKDLGLLHHHRRDGLFDGRRSSVLHHVFEQDLLESARIVQKVGSALGKGGDLFEVGAVDVLPQPDRRDGDLVLRRLAGERHAVALLGNTVRQQHNVFVDRVRGHDSLVSFRESGGDLRASVGRDTGHQALDGRAIHSSPNGHGPLERVIEDEHPHHVDWPQILDDADRS